MPTACAACTASAICLTIARHFVDGQRALSLRVLLEDLAGGPLDREEVHARDRLRRSRSCERRSDVARARRSALREETARPPCGPGAVFRAGPFTATVPWSACCARKTADVPPSPTSLCKRISGNRLTDEVLTWHAANLTAANRSWQAKRANTFARANEQIRVNPSTIDVASCRKRRHWLLIARYCTLRPLLDK